MYRCVIIMYSLWNIQINDNFISTSARTTGKDTKQKMAFECDVVQ